MSLTKTEITLAKKAAAGDLDALMQLLQGQSTYLYRTAYLYAGSEADALEIIQAATAQAVSGVRRLRQPEHFLTWFTRLLIRQAQVLYRRRAHEQPAESLPQATASSSDAAVHVDLLAALDHVQADYRLPLQLFYYQDLSITAISALLHLPEATIKTRLRRGRQALRDLLGENYES